MRKFTTLCLAISLGFSVWAESSPGIERRSSEPDVKDVPVPEARLLMSRPTAPSIGGNARNRAGLSSSCPQGGILLQSSGEASATLPAATADADLFGWMVVSSAGDAGWCSVDYDGNYTPVFNNEAFHADGFRVDAVWLDGGKTGMMVSHSDDEYIYGFWYYLFNEVGTVAQEVKLDAEDMFYRCAYNYTDHKVYGYNFSRSGEFQWVSFDPSTQEFTSLAKGIATSNFTARGMTYNSTTDKFVGLKAAASSNVVYIDPATGKQETAGSISLPDYNFGFAYSSSKDCYVINQVAATGCSLDCLDPATLSVTSSAPYSGIVEFSQLVQDEPEPVKIDYGAPDVATNLAANFSRDALKGKFSFNLPTVTISGVSIIGDVTYEAYADGRILCRRTARAGSSVSLPVEVNEEGMHAFSVKCWLGASRGETETLDVWIGNDTPRPPFSVFMNGATVSWTAVTKGVHDGYVDPLRVTYDVYLNDSQIKTGVVGTECASGITPDIPMDFYTATVEAVFEGKRSEPQSSAWKAYGGAFELPVRMIPDVREKTLFKVVNANNDSRTITYTQQLIKGEEVPLYRYQADSRKAADDWLFLPAMSFSDADALYLLSFNAFRHSSSSSKIESIEVKLATAPDPAKVVSEIQPAMNIKNAYDSSWLKDLTYYHDIYFSVPQAGEYYIGIHVVSKKNMSYFYMRDFSVSKTDGYITTSPKEVTDLSADAAGEGMLRSDVTFTMPDGDFSGTLYDASKTLTARVGAEGCEEMSVYGKPGETVTANIATLQGDNRINVTVYDGDVKGLVSSTTVYTGVHQPGAALDLTGETSVDNMSLRLKWSKPAESVDGGFFRPDGLKYYLCVPDSTGQYWELSRELGCDELETTVTLPAGTPENGYTYGIVASNEAGFGDVTGSTFMLGTPWSTPLYDDISDGLTFTPVFTSEGEGDSNFRIDSPYAINSYIRPLATDDKRVGLIALTSQSATSAGYTGSGFILPRFSTEGLKRPAFGMEVCAGATDRTYIVASAHGQEPVVVASWSKDQFPDLAVNNVTYISVELPEQFRDCQWVQVEVRADLSSRDQALVIYSYKVFDNLDNDSEVSSISGLPKAKIGEESRFEVTIANVGVKSVISPGGKWSLIKADGTMLAESVVAAGKEEVAPGTCVTQAISFTPSADDLGELTLTYSLTTPDDREQNDSASKTVEVVAGSYPVVTDLRTTEVGADKVSLAWTLPEVHLEEVMESFEDAEPFVSESEDKYIGSFRRIDGDGKPVYGSKDPGFGNIPGVNQPSSFMVWSASEVAKILGVEGRYPSRSGDRFLIAFCPSDGSQADDWLISPKVKGGSEVTVWIRALTYQYGAEKVEAMYSSGGDRPEMFWPVGMIEVKGDMQSLSEWKKYTFTLPEEAEYFALHYVSTDIFGLMIDDISYTPAGFEGRVEGFNVYRDDKKIAGIGMTESFDDTSVEGDTSYDYYVTPVISGGTEGIKSNTVEARTLGIDGVDRNARAVFARNGFIEVRGYDGQPVEIVRADGIVVTSSVGDIRHSAEPGVYIVKAADDVVRLIVR